MSQAFNGTSQSASVALDLSGQSIITASAWLNLGAFASNAQVIYEFTADGLGTAGGFSLQRETSGGLTVLMGSIYYAGIYTQTIAGSWHNVVTTFDKTISNHNANLWIDGALQTPTTEFFGSNGGAFANSTLFISSRNNTSLWSPSPIQELAFWGGESLASGDIKQLAAGLTAKKVRPSKLINFWPFENGLIDVVGGKTMTNNGSSASYDSPPIFR